MAKSECGASAVEYSLVVVALAAIIVFVIFAIGGMTGTLFTGSCESLEAGYASASAAC